MDFTSSVDEIQDEISKVKPDGGTAWLDAIYLGLDRMKKAHNERKVLLVIPTAGTITAATQQRKYGRF